MFGISGFGGARIREALHRFGPRNPRKTRLAAERPASEWRKEAEKRQSEDEKEKEEERES